MCIINSSYSAHREQLKDFFVVAVVVLFPKSRDRGGEKEIPFCDKTVGSLSYLLPFHPAWLSLLQPAVYQEYGGKTNI